MLLITVSAFFLWRNTLKPISKSLQKEGMLSGKMKQGLMYLTGQGQEAEEDALYRQREKLQREEQLLQEKLEQLRKKRESLTPPKPADPPPEPDSPRPPDGADRPIKEQQP